MAHARSCVGADAIVAVDVQPTSVVDVIYSSTFTHSVLFMFVGIRNREHFTDKYNASYIDEK